MNKNQKYGSSTKVIKIGKINEQYAFIEKSFLAFIFQVFLGDREEEILI